MAVKSLVGAAHATNTFPPSPPRTVGNSHAGSDDEIEDADYTPPTPPAERLGQLLKPYTLPPQNTPTQVLPEDLKTPDNRVNRDTRLIRLTGVHPFNVEPPLTDLYDEGFLTSENLHYVRNHGAVPHCPDDESLDWTFTVDGLVEKPFTITVRDLIQTYEQLTYPVTLVCAGNRRKEQNVVRKSKGFSWGAAGLSTALWTGVPIGALLRMAKTKRNARYVCFEGADKLPNGYYGTSVKLNWCMDENRGIMVAHKMNGQALHPDHGKPVRIIIPGQIGGRSVKWLKKITITSEPSDNWYHVYDNRVLPTTISPDASANLPDVWKDEKYAIYDLNVNSAICYPRHDEKLALKTAPETYKVRGYAYGGGGKRITRVEVTLNKGKSWQLADIHYPEDDYRGAPDGDTLYGGSTDMWWREACFCWCFWEADVAVADLAAADDVMIRAMDEGMMVQPRDMYWSVLGMMNNPWFRVVIHRDEVDGTLRFEHPTQPALMPGGWMERVKAGGGDLTNGFWGERKSGEEAPVAAEPEKEICMTNPKVDRVISLEELKAHEGETEPWFVVNGHVYDGTPYLNDHPGGATSIINAAAQDATEEFMTIHSENAKAMMPQYHIGILDDAARKALQGGADEEMASDPTRAVFLQPKTWSKAVLEAKTTVSSDSKIFSFRLDHADQSIGLPTGQHLLMRLRDAARAGEAVIRAYTPLSETHARGRLDVLVKIYPDGRMTRALDAVPLGDTVGFKGPVGKFTYLGGGRCEVAGAPRRVRRFVMVCAGSGVTPIFQVLRAVTATDDDETACLVLDGNRGEEDILCRVELDDMVKRAPERTTLLHTLSRPADSWQGLRGRMDETFLKEHIGAFRRADGEEMVLVCGPPALEETVRKVLGEMAWKPEDMLFF
ncbi:nitrate reductase [Cordyceps fumosorosea ARSEF 2679]|uniref:Nitrate reductase n=1 Tax=Cordyceps fumosorosea (strain ARSEF 2679) TaxID=1081104 RepID=A0A168AQ77_CORFA|nr:nitrate reductase [Cordyceps fumosorosea ARSEF 2679]OAA69041.1 nitrate reductase [Cordyceps fumosorosea ARSEF 2679]